MRLAGVQIGRCRACTCPASQGQGARGLDRRQALRRSHPEGLGGADRHARVAGGQDRGDHGRHRRGLRGRGRRTARLARPHRPVPGHQRRGRHRQERPRWPRRFIRRWRASTRPRSRGRRGGGRLSRRAADQLARITAEVEKGKGWAHALIYEEPVALRRMNQLLATTQAVLDRVERGEGVVGVLTTRESTEAARKLVRAMERIGRIADRPDSDEDCWSRCSSTPSTRACWTTCGW